MPTRPPDSARRRPQHWLPAALALGAALFLTPGLFLDSSAWQTVLPPAVTVRLSPADAARLSREGRQSVAAQLAEGLELTLWAPGVLLADPIAIDIDTRGVAYVSSSPRSGQLLDIRQHANWVPEVHALRTVDDLRGFYQRTLAPERSAENPWLPDFNHDGSRDWRDLAVIKERVYRLEDTSGGGVADLSRVVYDSFDEDAASDIAGGLLVYGRDLFVALAPNLWKLRDTNGDGVFDEKESVSYGYSNHPAIAGHDLSALTLGPDGRIYWKVGDIGLNVVDSTGRRWVYPNQGAVLRANPDGSEFEVFAAGLRNTQEIAFDEHGNLIAVDNDGDYPGETERVVHITQGSDTGWRSTWQYGKYTDPRNNTYNVWIDEGLFKPRFDGQAAYIVPPIAPYHAGPAGFAYNPGTALDDRWRGHFFVTSFTGNPATSRIYAFQLNERGAGFELASDTQILRGIASPGMRVGPDGALYFTDWINGFAAKGTGRVWKLDAPGAAAGALRVQTRALLSQDLSSRSATELRIMMRHLDLRVRQRAQFELVRRRDIDALVFTALQDSEPLARIHAVWGMGQLARADPRHAAQIARFLRDPDPELRAQAAKMLGDARASAAAESIIPLLRDPAARPRFFAAEALGRIKYARAVAPIVQMLADNDDRDAALRHAGSYALASIGDAPAIAALAQHSSRAVRLAAVVALRRLRDPSVARFLQDPAEAVVVEAARAINDEGGIAAALPALARLLDETRFTNEALLRRAISANLRLGTAEAADRLAAFAAAPASPRAMGAEAANALATWTAPSMFDRVDGSYLGPTSARDPSVVQRALQRARRRP
jgi:putative membrane-bound dehydrogenase-like protein